MKLTSEQREVLDLASEDWYGLWEVVWRLNTIGVSSDRSKTLALDVVRTLLDLDLIELFICVEGRFELAGSSAASRLDDSAAWNPPSSRGSSLWIGATERGLKAMLEAQ